MIAEDLPYIDRHCIDTSASRNEVWVALGEVLSHGFGGIGTAMIAGVLGTRHRKVTGQPLAIGSTIVGFRVAESQLETRVVLAGHHRFSRYTLTFELDDRRLCAITHAEFPGIHGAAYKTLILGSRGHVVATKRLLGHVKKRAELTGPR